MEKSETWEAQNQRRVTPIRKCSVETLTEAEQSELQRLQDIADQQLEARDHELLAQLDRLKQAIDQLPSDAGTT